jgi:putative FmdB family regulatory protein
MPIYEYYCEVCKSNFELIQKISDKPAKKCIKCNKSTKVIKLVSAPGFRLKGGGWYETDFKNGSKKNIHDSENKTTNTDKKEN